MHQRSVSAHNGMSSNSNEERKQKLRLELLAAKPLLPSTPISKQSYRVFKLHLHLCTELIYNFGDASESSEEKVAKRALLIGLVDYISKDGGAHVPEEIFSKIVKMISANLFRSLPPRPEDYTVELDDDDLKPEPCWPHIQVVYELLNRFILCSSVDARMAKKYVTQDFIRKLIGLFESDDIREREYLKNILHRIYAKFMVHRAFIRRCIKEMFLTVTYEKNASYNGLAEVLEILASIINGFALPLKKEHVDNLVNVLIPLHKVRGLEKFHRQLFFCVHHYVEKDKNSAVVLVNGIIKLWPINNSSKQVLLLQELEEIVDLTLNDQVFEYYMAPLITHLGKCLESPHFQVVERSLLFLQNTYVCKVVASKNGDLIVYLISKLKCVAAKHWNPLVTQMSLQALSFLQKLNELTGNCTELQEYSESRKSEREQRWIDIVKSVES